MSSDLPRRRWFHYLLMWGAIILMWVIAGLIGAVMGQERRRIK